MNLRQKLQKLLERRALVGIDLGQRHLRAVQLEKRGSHVVLKNYWFTDLASVFDGFPVERDEAQVLNALAEINRLKGFPTATALPDSEVLDYPLTLPPLPKDEVRVAVQYELSNLSRIPDSEMAFDFWMEGAPPAKGAQTSMKIRGFVSRLATVENHLNLLKEAGFQPRSVESRMLATIEALRFNGFITAQSSCAVIDMGESQTTIGFVRAGALVSSRSEKLGSGTLNQSVQKKHGLTYSEAEKYKQAYRVGDPVSSGSPDETMEEVYLKLFRFFTGSIEAHLDASVGTRLEQVLLVGGGTLAPGFDGAIRGILKLPTLRADPLKNIQIYSDEKSGKDEQIGSLAPYMATAIGLALRSIKWNAT